MQNDMIDFEKTELTNPNLLWGGRVVSVITLTVRLQKKKNQND